MLPRNNEFRLGCRTLACCLSEMSERRLNLLTMLLERSCSVTRYGSGTSSFLMGSDNPLVHCMSKPRTYAHWEMESEVREAHWGCLRQETTKYVCRPLFQTMR